MKKFCVGERFVVVTPLGRITYEIINRTETVLNCSYLCNQGLNGVQVGYKRFRINLNCYGDEYVKDMFNIEFHAYTEMESEVE